MWRDPSHAHAQMAWWACRKCCGQKWMLQGSEPAVAAGAARVSSCRKQDLVRKRGGCSRQMEVCSAKVIQKPPMEVSGQWRWRLLRMLAEGVPPEKILSQPQASLAPPGVTCLLPPCTGNRQLLESCTLAVHAQEPVASCFSVKEKGGVSASLSVLFHTQYLWWEGENPGMPLVSCLQVLCLGRGLEVPTGHYRGGLDPRPGTAGHVPPCYRPNVCVLPFQICMVKSNPQCNGVRRWGLWEVIR